MMHLSAFADEVSPELDEQIAICKANGVTHFELRSVWDKNVLDFDSDMRTKIKSKLQAAGLQVISIASPIGKSKISDPWDAHFARFRIAVESAEFFAAPFIRIFSYYPPEPGQDIRKHRDEIMRRMRAKVDFVKHRPVMLLHENEKAVYGSTGKDCLDLMKTIDSPKFRNIFDFANFVQEKERPLEIWPMLKPYTVHIHVKDARLSDGRVVPAGAGDGDVEAILIDLHRSGYAGFLSLEPHLKEASQYSGFSGPVLFKQAADALKAICDKNGIQLVRN